MQTQSDFGTRPSPLILDLLVLISQRRFVSCVQFLQDGRQVGLKLFLKLDACWYTRPNHTVPATPEWRKQAGVESSRQNVFPVFDRIKFKKIFFLLCYHVFFSKTWQLSETEFSHVLSRTDWWTHIMSDCLSKDPSSTSRRTFASEWKIILKNYQAIDLKPSPKLVDTFWKTV